MISLVASPVEYRYGDPNVSAINLTASGATGTVEWSTTSGELQNPTGSTNVLTPLNQSELITVTVTDSANQQTATVSIQVWGTLPFIPNWGGESDLDVPIVRWPMTYEQRSPEEYELMLQFFEWHKKANIEISEAEDGTIIVRVVKGIPFYVEDIALGELAFVYFDSPLRRAARLIDWLDYSFRLVSFDFSIPDEPAVGPFIGEPPTMLLEDGGFILLEDGGLILLEN